MKKHKLELYYFTECPYCQIVLTAIQEYGLEQEVTLLNTRQHPEYRQKIIEDTGRGTVPCLYIDNRPMHESADIARWLGRYAQELKL